MTSSSSPTPSASRAITRASVPELTPIACATPSQSATSRSKASTFGPSTNWPLRSTALTAAVRSSQSSSTSGWRSSIGMRGFAIWHARSLGWAPEPAPTPNRRLIRSSGLSLEVDEVLQELVARGDDAGVRLEAALGDDQVRELLRELDVRHLERP